MQGVPRGVWPLHHTAAHGSVAPPRSAGGANLEVRQRPAQHRGLLLARGDGGTELLGCAGVGLRHGVDPADDAADRAEGACASSMVVRTSPIRAAACTAVAWIDANDCCTSLAAAAPA